MAYISTHRRETTLVVHAILSVRWNIYSILCAMSGDCVDATFLQKVRLWPTFAGYRSHVR